MFKKTKIIFRCDASSDIGLGHLIRDLAIAKKMRKTHQIIFASIKDPANSYIKESGFKIFFKKSKEREEKFLSRVKAILMPDVIVFDKKYPYSSAILNSLKRNKIKIVIIDNICKGMKIADEIIFPCARLDKNLLKKFLSQKQIKQVKTGPKYVIIRDEILTLKKQVKRDFHTPLNIVITTGGSDPKGVLLKLISWLREMNLDVNFLILVGKSFKFQKKLKKIKKDLPQNFHILPYSLKELAKGDTAICTFGASIYEMIYLQIPCLCVSHSRENARGAKILEKRCRVIKDLGYINDIIPQNLYKAIKKLLTDKTYCKNMIKRCKNLIDARGAARVAKIIADE